MTTLTISNEELSTTAFAYLDDVRNMLDVPHPYVDAYLGTKRDEEGGERLIIPYRNKRHSITTQMSSGYEPISLIANPQMDPGNQAWFYAIRPVLISTTDDITNRGRAKIISKLEERIKDTHDGIRAEIEEQDLITGLAAMSDLVPTNGADDTGGMIEDAAVGSQTNTVHGISKGSFLTLPGWQNQFFNAGGSFSASGLAGMFDIQVRIKKLAKGAGKLIHRPDIKVYGSINGVVNYKRSLFPQERWVDNTKPNAGNEAMMFGDWPIETVDLPNAGTATTALPWTFLFKDWGGMHFTGQKGWVMKMDEFRWISGHVVRGAYLHLFGQNTARYYGTSGVLVNGEVF